MASSRSDYNIHIRAKDNYSKVMLKATLALAAIGVGMSKAIELANEQEAAEKKLETALGHTSQALLDQASALQKVSVFGDETIIKAQALIAAFVKDEEQIKAATKATLDLASAKGFDLVTAADLVSKTLGSSTNALTRYGIEVKGAVGSTERLTSLTGNINKVFGGQALSEIETFGGATKQVSNAMGDVLEQIGFLVTKSPAVIKSLKGVLTVFEEIASAMAVSDEKDRFDLHSENIRVLEGRLQSLKSMKNTDGVLDRQLLQAQQRIDSANLLFIETTKKVAVANRAVNVTKEKKIELTVAEVAAQTAAQKQMQTLLDSKGPGVKGVEGPDGGLAPEAVAQAQRLIELQTFHDNKMAMLAQQGATEEQMKIAFLARELDLEKQKEEQIKSLKKNALTHTAGFFNSLGAIASASGKKGQKTAIKMARAENAVNTAKAAMAAFSSLASIPIVGPALGAAAFVAAIARGKQQDSAIRSGSAGAGGGSISATAPSGGGGSPGNIPSVSAAGVDNNNAPKGNFTLNVDIKNLTGEVPPELEETLVEVLRSAVKRGFTLPSELIEDPN